MIIKFKQLLLQSLDENDKLSQFIKTLEYLNDDKPLKLDFITDLEEYFDYRWNHDKNQGLATPEDFMMLDQLPRLVQR